MLFSFSVSLFDTHGLRGRGDWNGVEKQLLIFPIAGGEQTETPMNADRMYWTVRIDYELKLNLMTDGVIVQMLNAKRPMSKPFSKVLLINLKVVSCSAQRFGCWSENFPVCITKGSLVTSNQSSNAKLYILQIDTKLPLSLGNRFLKFFPKPACGWRFQGWLINNVNLYRQ